MSKFDEVNIKSDKRKCTQKLEHDLLIEIRLPWKTITLRLPWKTNFNHLLIQRYKMHIYSLPDPGPSIGYMYSMNISPFNV